MAVSCSYGRASRRKRAAWGVVRAVRRRLRPGQRRPQCVWVDGYQWTDISGVERRCEVLRDATQLAPDVAASWCAPAAHRSALSIHRRALQTCNNSVGVRLELYDKQYTNLWHFTRTYDAVGGGRGRARGADLMLRWRLNALTRSRLAWSVVQSRRTERNTGVLALTPGDVRHSVTSTIDRTFGRLTVSSALRQASGRQVTDATGDAFGEPVWDAPTGSRLPVYSRSDIGASWSRPIDGRRALVFWGDLSNVCDRGIVMRYRYTAGYRERPPVRAPFNRVSYARATLQF